MFINEADALTQSQKQLEILMAGSQSNFNYSGKTQKLINELMTQRQYKKHT